MVKNLLAMQETWVQFLGREDTLKKEMATHSSILAWKIPWTACWAVVHGVRHDLHLHFHVNPNIFMLIQDST